MESADMLRFARNFSVMVRSQGPDPKGLKMRRHAFHLHQSGCTTLSASGVLLPAGCLADPPQLLSHACALHDYSGTLVLTVASAVEPFLVAEHRNNPTQEFFPRLIPGACIDVLVGGEKSEKTEGEELIINAHQWKPSQLLGLIAVSESSDTLLSLFGAHGGLEDHSSWEVGWSLASSSNDPLPRVGVDVASIKSYGNDSSDEMNSPLFLAKSTTRLAILGIPTVQPKNVPRLNISQQHNSGDILLVMGSPFGILSPLHFFNSIYSGAVANCCPPGSPKRSLLMADVRCLPGMEGSPVFNRKGCLIGMLISPLRHKSSRAEIQLIITWDAIASAQAIPGDKREVTLRDTTNRKGTFHKHLSEAHDLFCPLPSRLRSVMLSIALITVSDGSWASGVVLNDHGLILTNAHLLEPWRFGRASLLAPANESVISSLNDCITFGQNDDSADKGVSQEKRHMLHLSQSGCADNFQERGNKISWMNEGYQKYKRISVRLDHMEHHSWCSASVVYISKGPIDVALLQLESLPSFLCPIKPEFSCPPAGLSVYIIGHGLIGPQSDLHPSVSTGVVSNVFRTLGPVYPCEPSINGIKKEVTPVMLQTTAAVHAGASGGAVVDTYGRMIGLVTSNARHRGGSTIPHMNFSIPCAALEPIFKFVDKQDFSTLHDLDKPNELLSSVWALTPSQSSIPESAAEKDNREVKGSRFAKFLDRRRVDTNTPEDLEKLIKLKLPSSRM